MRHLTLRSFCPCVLLLHRCAVSPQELTALQTYVNTPDANFQWSYHPEFDMQGDGYKVMWLNMTSLRWLTDADVSKSIWVHWVAIVVPNTLNPQFSEVSAEKRNTQWE